uniref:Uncharacterized protein n=1 Tax=Oryza brachyantha TaxID=4533 RepID=J3MSG5_ORYBR
MLLSFVALNQQPDANNASLTELSTGCSRPSEAPPPMTIFPCTCQSEDISSCKLGF